MPKLTVNGKSAEFPADKRLVLAIEELGVPVAVSYTHLDVYKRQG